jgi:predicted RNA-binding Zn-ribbon protein involved in translation (DUF1610 family)
MGVRGTKKRAKYPQLGDQEWLTSKYVTEGLSCPQVAELIGCTASAVELRLEQYGIPRRGRHYNHWNPKECERCGKEFTPGGPAAKFCSPECRTGERTCEGCAKAFKPHKLAEGQGAASAERYCSDECRGWARSAATVKRWAMHECRTTPTRRQNGDGYIRLYFGRVGGEGFSILEHRYVMEQYLGRELLPDETVHHKDNRRRDWNVMENLQLRQGAHGKGSVFQCRDCGSHNVEAIDLADPEEAA